MHTDAAEELLMQIRDVDDRLGLISVAVNERSTYLSFDILHGRLSDLGFGLDDNGNYPAL